MLKIYDTKTGKKIIFKSLNPKQVNMYICGMTVYDRCHLGHARTFIIFDTIYRFLLYIGYKVNYVRNITDIDDKIIKRANELNCSIKDLTDKMIAYMHEDFAKLGNLSPTQEPRATEHISEIIAMIKQLMILGYAYKNTAGDICYRINKFAAYGNLSGQSIQKLRSGSRVNLNDDKQNPLDFILWKKSKLNEPSWDSPWGSGRPGWHIECSAMCQTCLTDTIDIHGGGMDLLFPHHENEVAQSEAITQNTLAKYWLHSGFLQINNEKMSKSLNNFLTINEILTTYNPETLRYFLLTTHYRAPFNYSDIALKEAHTALYRLYNVLQNFTNLDENLNNEIIDIYQEKFNFAMNDDFNTPMALSVLFDLAHYIQRQLQQKNIENAKKAAIMLKYLGGILGILQQSAAEFCKQGLFLDKKLQLTNKTIESLISKRNQARKIHDWQLADQIRQQLLTAGIILEDEKNNTKWRYK